MKPILDTTSELEAVNYILRASGDVEVSSLDVSSLTPEAETVYKYLQRSRMSILEKGFVFNTRKDVQLPFTNYKASDAVVETYPSVGLLPSFDVELHAEESLTVVEMYGDPTAPYWRDIPYVLNNEGQDVGDDIQLGYELYYITNSTRWEFRSQGTLIASTGVVANSPYPPKTGWTLEAGYYTAISFLWASTKISDAGTPLDYIAAEAVYENRIAIPADSLDVELVGHAKDTYFIEPEYIINKSTSSYHIETSPYVNIISDYNFTDLKTFFREWITYQAGYEYIDQVVGDDKVAKSMVALLGRAESESQRWNIKHGRFSLRR